MAEESSNDLVVCRPDAAVARAVQDLLAQQGWGGYAQLAGFLQARRALIGAEDRVPLVLAAGDTVYAHLGISCLSRSDATPQFVRAISTGEHLLTDLAQNAGVEMELIEPRVCPENVATPSDFTSLLAEGRRLAHRIVDRGHSLIGCAAFGRGNSTVAGAVVGALTKTEPVVMAGSPFLIGDEGWKRKVEVIRDAMFSVRPQAHQAHEVARLLGSPACVLLIGFIAQAAARGATVLIDGPIPAAAALCAEELAPGTRDWVLAAHSAIGPVEDIVHRRLGLPAATRGDIAVPGGAGLIASIPTIRQAACVAARLGEEGAGLAGPLPVID